MLESETVIYVGAEEKCKELLMEQKMALVDEEKIREEIHKVHPELVLENPLYLEDIWCERIKMDSSEEYFAEMLLEWGVFLYREPKIRRIQSRFDFFACNPMFLNGGILIEITRSNKSGIRGRKKRQLNNLELVKEVYGIPGIVLFKSDLIKIANSCSDGLFSVL